MLTPFDDYPIHQTSLPVAHPASGDPNHYDRFWFNGYTEDFYFAAGMAVYPNRGIIDGAFAVVHDGVQRSVFASGRIPVDRGETRIGPLTIEVEEPLRVTRVRADAADLGIDADVTFTARTVALEEPRQIITAGTKTVMDSTRMTQWGTWNGRIDVPGRSVAVEQMYGTKDRSWGVRPDRPAGGRRARSDAAAGLLPLGADQLGRLVHALPVLRARQRRPLGELAGRARRRSAPATHVFGADARTRIHHLARRRCGTSTGRPGCGARRARRCACCATTAARNASSSNRCSRSGCAASATRIPNGATATGTASWPCGSEEHKVEELDNVEPWNIHMQQVMRRAMGRQGGARRARTARDRRAPPERAHRHHRRLLA